jgi:peptide/nickel transport system substrate-binding protein
MRYKHTYAVVIVAVLSMTFTACDNGDSVVDDSNEVTIRISAEPDNLNPTRSRSSQATPIESLILMPLAEFDPFTFDLTPLIVKTRARVEDITDGPHAGGQKFHYEMREEANWDDGTPITGYDYAFTVKVALNPKVEAAVWRGFLSFIQDVEVDPENPKKFAAIVAEPYMLAELVTCNFNLFPKHVYDPNGIMDDVRVADLSDESTVEKMLETDARLEVFARGFASVGYNRDTVEGAGPYKLVEWITSQHLVLERKEKWWGDLVPDAPDMLHAYPKKITYRVIPDENSAIAALKDGSVDLMSAVSAPNFVQMRDDPQWQEMFEFLTPELLQHRYLEINNRHEILREQKVRQALAYAVDYKAIIENIELGMGERTIGPFARSKVYYNDTLEVIEQDLDAARKLLAEAGWEDTNNDGVVDKIIDGQRTELNLEIVTTMRPAGRQVALLIKESGAKIGIEIDIVTKDANTWRQGSARWRESCGISQC